MYNLRYEILVIMPKYPCLLLHRINHSRKRFLWYNPQAINVISLTRGLFTRPISEVNFDKASAFVLNTGIFTFIRRNQTNADSRLAYSSVDLTLIRYLVML